MLIAMREREKKRYNFILALSVAAVTAGGLTAEAGSISDVQNQINKHTDQLENSTNRIVELESEQDILREQIDDLNAEILNTMTSISLKEDEIAVKEEEIALKEEEIAAKEQEINAKQEQIEKTEAEYEAAVEREEKQRENMAVCARLIYERGTDSYLDALLEGKGMADVLNQLDRIERVQQYENAVLTEYINTKNEVHNLWLRLEEEKMELEADRGKLRTDREQLEADRSALEADKADLQSQKVSLNAMLEKKKKESANFDAEIKKAREEAAAAKKLLQQDKQKLKQLQAAQNAAGSGSTGGSSAGSGSGGNSAPSGGAVTGSGRGSEIANFACQYVGNPYVSGGTSLTNGADCSGFTYRVFSEFGYSLPRTSYQQRSAGTGVSYENAQPGDLICYEGHVGIYIGNGMIVHASNSSPYPAGGIKISQAQYRTILAVRRIVN